MKISKRMINFTFRMSTFLLAITCANAYAGVAVVVNQASDVSSLSVEEAKAVFLGKVSTFPNGSKAIPVDQPEGSAIRVAFSTKVLGKSEGQLKAYWSKKEFTGKGYPLKSVGSSAAVKAFVSNTPSGIGYIDDSQVDGTIKVVLTSN